jgi:hypothetical protein
MRDLERWIDTRDDRRVRLFLNDKDKLRLLRLRVWSMRYKISIPEILDLIVKPLRKKVRGRARGLGLSIATLTGAVAEEILEDRIVERYPDGANISAWKETERDRQLLAEWLEETDGMPVHDSVITLLEVGDVEDYTKAYATRIAAARKRNESELWRRRRKRYRGNPWL